MSWDDLWDDLVVLHHICFDHLKSQRHVEYHGKFSECPIIRLSGKDNDRHHRARKGADPKDHVQIEVILGPVIIGESQVRGEVYSSMSMVQQKSPGGEGPVERWRGRWIDEW